MRYFFTTLEILLGAKAASSSSVKNWFNEFNSLEDEYRESTPKTAVVPENIDAVMWHTMR